MSPTLAHIRLMADPPGNDARDSVRGYELIVPVNRDGRLDPLACETTGAACRAIGVRDGAILSEGRLQYRSSTGWVLCFAGDRPDETGIGFEWTAFVPGAYVTLRQSNSGRERRYRVAMFGPASA